MAQFVSAIRRRIIERVVFTENQLDCLDLYSSWGPRIVNRRNRTLIPIVRERDATGTPPKLLRKNCESRAYSIWLANGTVPAFTWNCNHSRMPDENPSRISRSF